MSAQSASPERLIYLAACKLQDPEVRREYLDEACGADHALRNRLKLLLNLDAVQGSDPLHEALREFGHFSTDDTPDNNSTTNDGRPTVRHVDATVDVPIDISEHPVIGRYKLLEELGRGGMGAVYMAQQSTPVKRMVALKIIKPGMDSREVIARFQAERQALALMDHPNIARVLDAGTTDEGRPYFVMELVRGVPITNFCEEKNLTLEERLKLFIDVCKAVQHAHQKAIIHRDLKPSNILVTLHDGEPVVKVIDFGVAKALDQDLTDQTLFTKYAQLIGTPLYMSPEQAEMSGLDVDTRSDIYALGVILYELLTGTTPIERESLANLGFDAVRKLVLEQEPERPSSRVSTLKASADSTVAVPQQQSHNKVRAKQLYRELDWIVMKALEKDRTRRYQTANGLAADIQRYIDGEAVEACPPSLAYRLRKIAGRNRAAFTSAMLITFVLITGIAGTSWQAVRAMQSEKDAQQSAKQAETNLEIAKQSLVRADANLNRATQAINDYLGDVATNMELMAPGLAPLRNKLLSRALQFNQELMQENPNDLALKQELAMNYFSLAVGELISIDESILYAEHARQVLKDILAATPQDTVTARRLAHLEAFLGDRERQAGRIDKALQIHRASRATLESLLEHHPANESIEVTQRYLARSILEIARDLDAKGDIQEAVNEAERSFGVYRELVDNESNTSDHRLSTFYNGLMQAAVFLVDRYIVVNKLASAREINREAQELLKEKYGEIPGDPVKLGLLADLIGQRAAIETHARNLTEAVDFQSEELDLRQTLVEQNPGIIRHEADLARAYLNMNYRLAGAGLPQVKEYHLQSIEIRTRLWDKTGSINHLSSLAIALQNYANDLEDQGEVDEALKNLKKLKTLYQEVLEYRRRVLGEDHSDTLTSLDALAGIYYRLEDYARAETQLEALLEHYRDKFGRHSKTAGVLETLCLVYRDEGKLEESLSAAEESFEIFDDQLGSLSHKTLVSLNSLAIIYGRLGRWEEAQRCYGDVIDRRQQIRLNQPDDFSNLTSLGGAQCNLAHLLRDRQECELAVGRYREAIRSLERAVKSSSPRTAKLFLSITHWGYGQALQYLGRYKESLVELELAKTFARSDKKRDRIEISRLITLAADGRMEEAANHLEALLPKREWEPEDWYCAASVYSIAGHGFSTLDASEGSAVADRTNECYERAVQLLSKAADAGYFSHPSKVDLLEADPNFATLHGRSDYTSLLSQLK